MGARRRSDFFRRTAGRTGVELMRELFGPMTTRARARWSTKRRSIYRERSAAAFREVAGFTAFARAARAAGITLACATAGDAGNIAFALRHLGMEDFFDAVAGGHEVTRGKPAPDLFAARGAAHGRGPARLRRVRGCAAAASKARAAPACSPLRSPPAPRQPSSRART